MTATERARPATLAARTTARRLRRAWVACVLALVVATGFAGWSAWSWYHAGHSDSVSLATARDHALRAGKREVVALHTVDYRHVKKGLHNWLAATTGPLHEQLQRTAGGSKTKLAQAKATTTGSVTAAAITALDLHAGTATLIASVSVHVTRDGGKATAERNRYRAAMNRTPDGWKLSSLAAIPAS